MPNVVDEMGGEWPTAIASGRMGTPTGRCPTRSYTGFITSRRVRSPAQLLGRRLSETMVYRETADKGPSDIACEFALPRRSVRI
jgi:hypothetical protein